MREIKSDKFLALVEETEKIEPETLSAMANTESGVQSSPQWPSGHDLSVVYAHNPAPLWSGTPPKNSR